MDNEKQDLQMKEERPRIGFVLQIMNKYDTRKTTISTFVI